MTTYFFGCINGRSGHYLWRPSGVRYESIRHQGVLPWTDIDAALCPGKRPLRSRLYAVVDNYVENGEQVEGWAALHHRDGWTALAWWDRSVDPRYGSNAALFAPGNLTADQVLAVGREHFAGFLDRMTYQVRLTR